ncbi:MAG TPA: hypothetical protein VLH38_05445 [Patescibacteria group bacterium]|nr:hypothetical protein [Patescibacteria group bacterium]
MSEGIAERELSTAQVVDVFSVPEYGRDSRDPWNVLAEHMGAVMLPQDAAPEDPLNAVVSYEQALETIAFLDPRTEAKDPPQDAVRAMPEDVESQPYKGSLVLYHELGRHMLSGTIESPEAQTAKGSLKREWLKTIAEVIKLDPELRPFVEITDVDHYPIMGGFVMTPDGKRRMTHLVEDGAEKSRREAAIDPRWHTLARRDEADTHEALEVDDIAAGRTAHNGRGSVSREPAEAMALDPKFYEQKGFREGFSFYRQYALIDGEMMTITLSLDNISKEVYMTALSEIGVTIMPEADEDMWVAQGAELMLIDAEHALQFAGSFRSRCYELQGDTSKRLSVNDFMDAHADRLDVAFETLCVPMGAAIVSGIKDPAIHAFVEALLSNSEHFTDETVERLQAIYTAPDFDEDKGRFMAGIAGYAVAEDIRDEAKRMVQEGGATYQAVQSPYINLAAAQVVQRLAGRVHVGVREGRSHGGPCPGVVDISKNADGTDSDDPMLNPQAAYGDRDKSKENCKEVRDGDLVNCPNCKQPVRAIVPKKGGEIFCSNGDCTAAYAKNSTKVPARPVIKKTGKAKRTLFAVPA